MKLLLISPKTDGSKGGMAIWTDIFLRHCQTAFECDLLNIATIGERAENGNAKRNFLDEVRRTKAIFRDLRRLLNSATYDVAQMNTSCGAFGLLRDYLTVRAIKRAQPHAKRVVHFHCDIQTQCASAVSLFVLKRLLAVTDRAIVLNEKNAQFLRQRYGVEANKMANFIEDARVRRGGKEIAPIIRSAVFVGYVQPTKGAREIYDLASRLSDIEFRLVGEVHEEVAAWEKPANVTLCGAQKRDEVMASLDAADIFVFPSHSEGFSMALLEAMARGLPAVATAVGANEEMLGEDGGCIVAVGDTDAMERAIGVMQSPAVREKMSSHVMQKVASQYTVTAVMEEFQRIYTKS